MKAAAITTYGSLDTLSILDLPVPNASPHEALIAVVSSTINPVDVKIRLPDTPQEVSTFPAVLGWDLAGVVVTAPPESAWRPGDRVIAMHPPQPTGHGCWQQYVTIDANHLAAAPTNVDLITAATLPPCRPHRRPSTPKAELAQGRTPPGHRSSRQRRRHGRATCDTLRHQRHRSRLAPRAPNNGNLSGGNRRALRIRLRPRIRRHLRHGWAPRATTPPEARRQTCHRQRRPNPQRFG